MLLDVSKIRVPVFRDRSLLSPEELTDPDFGMKQLRIMNAGNYDITCSRCHHCR